MKVAFFDAKPYDHIYFDKAFAQAGFKVKYYEGRLSTDLAVLAKGCDVVCTFVNAQVDKECINALEEQGVKLIALRCAGFNNVDFKAAFKKIHVVRVPAYSPYSVAEHAASLLLSMNRKIQRAHMRVREGNFTLNGLIGMDLHGKTAGVIGTGKIGQCFIDIAKGFGMRALAYDPFPNNKLDVEYVSLEELWPQADIISLHCPLTKETKDIVSSQSIEQMKEGVLLINTSRGGLIDTDALIEGLKSGKIGGAGLDVYEEEGEYFYEDFSSEVITDDNLLRLMSYPNVLVTSHQAFFTYEALEEIARVTVDNIKTFEKDEFLENEICYQCEMKGDCRRRKDRKNCW
ncbi:MAG: 2-hydroxyacid dehydrogenase [Oscillospiraceae bacterium]|jgi:D-lactate dehydrogenase|nr:2-hydroxyacid dehydrogenase [Oscillospiraceae bacterium]